MANPDLKKRPKSVFFNQFALKQMASLLFAPTACSKEGRGGGGGFRACAQDGSSFVAHLVHRFGRWHLLQGQRAPARIREVREGEGRRRRWGGKGEEEERVGKG